MWRPQFFPTGCPACRPHRSWSNATDSYPQRPITIDSGGRPMVASDGAFGVRAPSIGKIRRRCYFVKVAAARAHHFVNTRGPALGVTSPGLPTTQVSFTKRRGGEVRHAACVRLFNRQNQPELLLNQSNGSSSPLSHQQAGCSPRDHFTKRTHAPGQPNQAAGVETLQFCVRARPHTEKKE